MNNPLKKKILFFLIVSFYFLIFLNWSIEFTSPDEGKNAFVVLNMVKSKNFLIPYYNCNPRFEKPPMLYWAGCLISLIFGTNEFSLRLISALSAIGIMIFMFLIVIRFFDEDIAWKSILIFLTFPHIWIEARSFTPEMLLNFFSLGSIYFFLKKRPILGWIFLGLATLTKGPVGIILPFSVILFFKGFKKDFPIFNFLGIILFLLIGSSWYLYMLYKFGYFYFYKFFIQENIFRYTGKKIFHPYPFYYYIVVILITSLFFIPIYIKIFLNLNNLKFLYTSALRPFLFWFLLVLVFYSVSKNKLHHYILFAYPPLCIILANFVSKRFIYAVLSFSGILFLAIALFVSHHYEKERFVVKAKKILKNYRGEIYFYKSEISPLPFYLEKCIPKLENLEIPKKGIIVTKRKYENIFTNCTKIISAPEFNEEFILLKCDKN